jgi:HD superfamily phosphohydrolase
MVRPSKAYLRGGSRLKTFTLPVTGSVILAGPEIDIIGTPTFQRLAGIKQLGTTYVVYRGALHTRFEHSLGALHQAERMLRALEANPRAQNMVTKEARRLARLGALLHDVTHVPFGHTLEDEFDLLERHDANVWRINRLLVKSDIGKILANVLGQADFDELVKVLKAKTEEDFGELRFAYVGDIVGNTVCADLLDYVPRDLNGCGMGVEVGDRFLDYLTLTEVHGDTPQLRIALNVDKGGMPRPDVESEVVKLLTYRYELAERVYFHHAKNAASVMIARAVQDAGFAVGKIGKHYPRRLDSNFSKLSDDSLLLALSRPKVSDLFGLVRHDGTTVAGIARARKLADGVRLRQLYKIAYLVTFDDVVDRVDDICTNYGSNPGARRDLEDRLARRSGLACGHVLVHVPRARMMTKDADVLVRTDSGGRLKLQEWDSQHSRRVQALNEAHRRLWRLTVYVHPKVSAQQMAVVQGAAASEFHCPSRYVKRLRRDIPYLRAVFEAEAPTRDWTMRDWVDIKDEAEGVAALSEAGTYTEVVADLQALIEVAREVRTQRPTD